MIKELRAALVGVAVLGLSASLTTGCAGNHHAEIEPLPGVAEDVLPADADARAEAVRRDPVGYLHAVAERCRKLEQYTLDFTRFERRGLFQTMHGPEHIACWYRRNPYSVRMKWRDEDLKYDESTYTQGQNDGKVRFVTRWWCPPLAAPPSINRIDPQASVTWGESRRPVTHFGLEQLMNRTEAALTEAGETAVVTYEGLRQLPQTKRTVHHLHMVKPEVGGQPSIQELYIDVATDLPAGTVIKYASERIAEAYFYENVNTDVHLTDEDFLLTVERDGNSKGEKTK
ncbi:MAG: DUF1571 domain-containing protein [Phycisphaerae bacterium]